jgi:hypothetical protein
MVFIAASVAVLAAGRARFTSIIVGKLAVGAVAAPSAVVGAYLTLVADVVVVEAAGIAPATRALGVPLVAAIIYMPAITIDGERASKIIIAASRSLI